MYPLITWCLLCPVQTIFIIAVCNNQLLDWIENELIWILSFVPGLSSILPELIAKLNAVKAKYLKAPSHVATSAKVLFAVILHSSENSINLSAWACLLKSIVHIQLMLLFLLFSFTSQLQAKKWDFSVSSIWNTIVWLMIMNFSIKIMTSTAQSYLKKQQDKELAALTNKVPASACSN